MFESVLIANRGEIAVRVIRTLRRLGIRSIAVYSDADAGAPHVALADVAVRLGPSAPAESYLNLDRVIRAAVETDASAIHPGYGFLSENPDFARACSQAGITFVGPPPEATELLGDKVRAKLLAHEAGVPVLPGLERPGLSDEEIVCFAREDPERLPVMVKASAGGGGRGMRIVRALEELPEALSAARREALAGFGDDGLLVERFVERARHIEIQLMADAHGNVVHLGERECSLQRRHQKVMEESPSPAVDPELRARLGRAATALALRAGYVGAGTVEFLVPYDDPGSFAFLEVNARLQVEHPVTEEVTGLDLVELQLRVADGEPLPITQDELRLAGHSIEVRVCAEDPAIGFLPATGTVRALREPAGPGIRVDSGIVAGSQVSGSYDSLLLKLIATAESRDAALDRLGRALQELRLLGVTTNAGFLARLAAAPAVRAGQLDTGLIERGVVDALPPATEIEAAAIAAAAIETLDLSERDPGGDPWNNLLGWRLTGEAAVGWQLEPAGGEAITVTVVGPPADARVRVGARELPLTVARRDPESVLVAVDGRARTWMQAREGPASWIAAGPDAFCFGLAELVAEGTAHAGEDALEAPMPGSVLSVRVAVGDAVQEGEVLVVVESMKMELALVAPHDATVKEVLVSTGDRVAQGQSLVELEGVV